jgi:CheY-like chemotaxis protein
LRDYLSAVTKMLGKVFATDDAMLMAIQRGCAASHSESTTLQLLQQESAARATKTAKIIVTTIHIDTEDITTALLGRCDSYLVKPIDTAKLKKELKTLGLIR